MSVEIYATLGEPHEIAATLSDLRYLVFQGMKGDTGDKGDTGFSPEIRVTDITGGHRLDIYNELGYETVDVMDGIDGEDGEDGEDGVSPTVAVADIAGGHSVTITDATHPQGQSFAVMNGSGIPEDVKVALLDCFENVAWINDDGQTYYDALYAALYPPKTLVSISAVFTQGSAVIYDTDSLDTLKQYLTVTATYDDTSTGVVTNYTLSGTLTEGTSTITVLYSGKTTTFNLTVTANPVPSTYQKVEWVGSIGTSYLDGGPFILTNISETGMAQLNGYTIRMAVACGTPINGSSGTPSGMFVGFSSKAGTYVSSLASGGVGIGTAASGLLPNVVCTDTNDYVLEFSSTGLTLSSGTNSVTRNYSTSGDMAQQLMIGTSFVEANTASWLKYFGHIEVEKNGNLVGDFYPCYRKSDNVIGFYDIVTEAFFVNSGTGGTFTKGADI